MSKEQTPITDKVLDNILFKISICSSKYHKREVLREEINAKVLEALEKEVPQAYFLGMCGENVYSDEDGKKMDIKSDSYYETEVKPKYEKGNSTNSNS